MNPFTKPTILLGKHGSFLFKRGLRLSIPELSTHSWIVGLSGYGKSRYMAYLYLSLLKAGVGATLIDPQADTAQFVLATLVQEGYFRKKEAFDKILWLDLPKAELNDRFLPFNVFKQEGVAAHSIASQVKEAMHRAFPELAGGAATFDTLLPDCVELLMHNNLPIRYMHKLLTDGSFRGALLAKEADEDLVDNFRNVYDELRKADQVMYAGSVLRRARQITRLPILKYSLSQASNLLQYRNILDENQSVIVNLNLEQREAMRLLGSFMTLGFEDAAFSRGALQPHEREHLPVHFVMIDEIPEFLGNSRVAFEAFLSKTRKYRVFLIGAHQTMSQLDTRMQGAIQNARIKVVFKLDYPDAKLLAPLIGTVEPKTVRQVITEEESESVGMAEQWQELIQEISELNIGQAYVSRHRHLGWIGKHILKRKAHHVVKVKTPFIPTPTPNRKELEAVEQEYLVRYFRPKAEIEAELVRYRATETPTIQRRR